MRTYLKEEKLEVAEKMIPRLGTLAAVVQDLSSVPSTPMELLTMIYSFSCREILHLWSL